MGRNVGIETKDGMRMLNGEEGVFEVGRYRAVGNRQTRREELPIGRGVPWLVVLRHIHRTTYLRQLGNMSSRHC